MPPHDQGSGKTRKPHTAEPRPPVPATSRSRTLVRWGVLIAGVVLFNYLASHSLASMAETRLNMGASQGAWAGLAALAAYAALLAIPFLPGVEIGISLLVMQGAPIAPFVYVATVAGLSLSYLLGTAFATKLPCSFLRHMGLPRACAFVDKMKDFDRPARLQTLQDAAPEWVGRWIIGHRYILLALLINLPGNSFIGGGGGILLVAGLSRLFSYPAVLLTLMLATAPVPLAVWGLGTGIVQ